MSRAEFQNEWIELFLDCWDVGEVCGVIYLQVCCSIKVCVILRAEGVAAGRNN